MRQQASWIPRVMFLLDTLSCSFSLQCSVSSNRRDRPSHPDWTQPLSTPPWRREAWERLVRWPHTLPQPPQRRTAHTARSTGLQTGELVQSVPPTCRPRQIATNAPATPPWTPCCWSINSSISMASVYISQLLSHHTAPPSLSFELEEILKFGGGSSVQRCHPVATLTPTSAAGQPWVRKAAGKSPGMLLSSQSCQQVCTGPSSLLTRSNR